MREMILNNMMRFMMMWRISAARAIA